MDEIRRRTNSPPYIHEHDTVQMEALVATTDPICGYFAENPDYTVACGSPSTCSTPSGGKSWGCCDMTSCYIPATCEDASAPDCGGTAASLCPYSPIMKCTYGASSLCLHFIYQTASDDNAKVTSWGCGVTPTTYIIGPLQARQTSHHTASVTAPANDETHSSSGLSKDATIVLAVILPVVGLAILIAAAMLFLKRRKKRTGDVISAPGQDGEGTRSEMEGVTETQPVPAIPPYEMGDSSLRPELDGSVPTSSVKMLSSGCGGVEPRPNIFSLASLVCLNKLVSSIASVLRSVKMTEKSAAVLNISVWIVALFGSNRLLSRDRPLMP
ncbi:hypothetical protein FIE12Z_6920 [Fusarium flagelliforme]|uniref:Gram-positive cocci surface proteins LPxTG domain-containing protein n=1 Tax=Fusarium flagelliforme TaxID=2675880 RepID=A0A395MMM5_9HYPO|nr:hypothetical protein FIE12Z_6920 [Fusarium flagelliforme]